MNRRSEGCSAFVAVIAALMAASTSAAWFSETGPVSVYDGNPFEYAVPASPEQTKSEVAIRLKMLEMQESQLASLDTSGRQAGIVRIADGGAYNYAVLTKSGWMRVGNAKITAKDGDLVTVKIVIQYPGYLGSSSASMKIEYHVNGCQLANISGTKQFDCPAAALSCERVAAIGASGNAEISAWSGSYSFLNSTIVEVPAGTTQTYASTLPNSNGKTFRVSGGGTLKIPHGKCITAGSSCNFHVDKGSSVVFDFSGKSPLSSIIKLFNGSFDSSLDQLSFLVADEGTKRLSKLMLSGNGKGLEAHVAEIPSPGTVSGDGVTIGNAVPGFWYGLEYAALLSDAFLLDYSSVQTPDKAGLLKLTSAAAPADTGFYRVKVTKEKP